MLLYQLIPDFASAQQKFRLSDEMNSYREMRRYDSVIASQVPILHLPREYIGKSLPVSVDNSTFKYFPGIYDQEGFFTCQQYSGVAYTYTYERNRLLDRDGSLPENRFPTHYTWTFMNNADRYTGVSFFYSFQVLKEQGHITADQPGQDTAQGVARWISGYEKYYEGMKNRIRAVYAIPTNTPEGVLTLKHYLNDHLDGSSSGGVACFSASSNFQSTNVKTLPAGTPEAGKEVIIAFYPIATHGMTIIGYNDSIRYDLNGDGKFTNNLDISGDGEVDVRDWEIGAWRMANSYGTSWHDNGYSYILYRATALEFDYPGAGWQADRGIWNSSVYIVEPLAGYEPLLTIKLGITYNARNRIKIKAGVSADTAGLYPEHTMDFPIFSLQGGDHYMQGVDDSEERKSIETGFDITPLLSYIPPGQPAKFFLVVEEKDSLHTGEGFVNNCSFMDYGGGGVEYKVREEDVPVNDNSVTFLSAIGTIGFSKPAVTTEYLPAYGPGQAYHVQLEAAGGKPPLTWSLIKGYQRKEVDSAFVTDDQQQVSQEATYIPYKRFPLPFSFPFFGKEYDTLYINFYGFVSFDSEQLPYPYITDEESMMKRKKIIAPAFYMNSYYRYINDGIWVNSSPSVVTIRWESGDPYISTLRIRSELKLYPSGGFEFSYGNFTAVPDAYLIYTGYSAGDELNYQVETDYHPSLLQNRSFRFGMMLSPDGLSLTEQGLLSVNGADSSRIYDVQVRVSDANNIWSSKAFTLSDGPAISGELVCGEDSLLKFGSDAHLKIRLRNGSDLLLSGINLKLSSKDPALVVSDSLLNIPDIDPGSFRDIPGAFRFNLSSPLKDLTPVELLISVSSGGRKWEKMLLFKVSSPEISVPSIVVSDGQDEMLDPGEVAFLVAKISNEGSLYVEDLSAVLTTADTLVSVVSQPEIVISRMEASARDELPFLVSASRYAPRGYKAALLLSLTDHKSVSMEIPVTLSLGKVPVAIVNFTSDLTSMNAIKDALDSLKIPYTCFSEKLPDRMYDFSGLFITSGTSTGGHMLSIEESTKVADYLENGGNLFIEISSSWFYYYLNKTPLNPMLKYNAEKVPIYYYNSMSGIPGTFTNGMHFDYLHSMNHSTFSLLPKAPAIEIFSLADSLTFNFQIAYAGENYRTISSMVEYGWLSDGGDLSSRQTLMRLYLDFFNIEKPGPRAFFHCDRSTVCRWDTVHFTDDSFDSIVSWFWEFPGASPSTSTTRNPSVTYIDPGKYNVKLTVSDGQYSKQIIKEGFVEVQVCTGIVQPHPQPGLTVYPNPADKVLNVDFQGRPGDETLLILYDLAGRKVMEKKISQQVPSGLIRLDVSAICRGIYILRLNSGNLTVSAKIVIE